MTPKRPFDDYDPDDEHFNSYQLDEIETDADGNYLLPTGMELDDEDEIFDIENVEALDSPSIYDGFEDFNDEFTEEFPS